MTSTNPKLDLAKMNEYMNLVKFYQLVLKILSRTKILEQIKGHYSGTNFQKMMCNNPKLDLVNMNAYIKFDENMSSRTQDIELKRNCGVNQGP